MTTFPFQTRLRYHFDNTMARGTTALILWLTIVSTLLVLISAAIFYTLNLLVTEGGTEAGFSELLWFNLMHIFDPGSVSGDHGSWVFLLATFTVSVIGLFIGGTLIGLLTTGLDGRLAELRKGRSVIIENDHTIILGWSPHIFSIISNLLIANENRKRSCIAILADRDKTEMDDELREHFGSTGNTRIVCRSGNPMNSADLAIANPDAARSIIILSPQSDDPDAHVIKTLLAITNNRGRRAEPYNIVAEIRNEKNLEVARMVGRDEAQMVLAGELIARIAVQTSRQSGLSKVYMELLDFDGDEIYFCAEPKLTGLDFGRAALSYRRAALIGLRCADGTVRLNPPPETIINEGDRIIAIAEDDDRVIYTGHDPASVDERAIGKPVQASPRPERTLILGWNRRVPLMLRELDQYVAPGSETVIAAEREDAAAVLEELSTALHNLRISFSPGSTTERRMLEELQVGTFDHVIVVAYSDDLDVQEADARTLITLLHLREIAGRHGRNYSIVSEMMDVRNRELAEVTRADDFIVDVKLVSMLLSQLSENRELTAVFDDLFDAEGSELYLKPVENYVKTGTPVNFYTVTAAAQRRGEAAVGYRLHAHASDAGRDYGVALNPDKEETVVFRPGDRIITLAAD